MIYLAPIQGITDRIFRNKFPEYFGGVDCAMAPFISTSKRKKVETVILRELDPDKNRGLPVIPQILSRDPEDFIPLANQLYEMGYSIVNWNLGCPFPVVTGKGKGSGMLCYPLAIEQFLKKTIPAIKAKLSIKLRIGLAYPDEILALIPIFNRYPVEELIIHPRTGKQMYDGVVNLDIFEQCLESSTHEIVYNGDINTAGGYELLARRFPSIRKWMIGRGLVSNPFLAEEIISGNIKSRQEKIRILRRFHDDLLAEYSNVMSGPAHITDRMKGIWFYLGNFFENGEKIKKRINKVRTIGHYNDLVKSIFGD